MQVARIDYRDEATACQGLLVTADSTATPRPGVLVVHDIRGVGLYPEAHVERLLASGYAVFMADMFGGGTASRDMEHGKQMIGEVTRTRESWRSRIQAAFAAMLAQPVVDRKRVAAIGYCFGGATVLELALSGADLRAVISMHGALDRLAVGDTANIRARVLVCTGAADPIVPASTVQAFAEALAAGGVVDWQVQTFAHAKHSYTNPSAPVSPATGYEPTADRRSLAAALQLLGEAFV